MAISETVLVLAGGTAVLSILFGMRVAIRVVAGGAATPRSDGGQAAARITRERPATKRTGAFVWRFTRAVMW